MVIITYSGIQIVSMVQFEPLHFVASQNYSSKLKPILFGAFL
jgi:hypothetical protein